MCRAYPGAVCVESLDDRSAGRCVKCGMGVPKPPVLVRDTRAEWDIVEMAAKQYTASPRAVFSINRMADERAHDGPVRLEDDRDLLEELREELADARNYAVWRLQVDGEDHEDAPFIMLALAHVVAAWECLCSLET